MNRWSDLQKLAVSLALLASTASAAEDGSIPHLIAHGTTKQLIVDGKPFLALAGELHNSSASSAEFMQPIWPRMTAMHLNTVLASASWELVEPIEGQFDFKLIDRLIDDAHENHLHLVFLWFGSWKNGLSSYPPVWVKADPKRFPVARDGEGKPLDILSTLGAETAKADARSFAAFMAHLRDADKTRTVIAVQVENEVGMRGAARDHSPAADAAFDAPVPPPLMQFLNGGGDQVLPELRDRWTAAGKKTVGNWTQVFGPGLATDELFMAWHYATFVNSVAAAGKKEYPIPLYTNAWLDQPFSPTPGEYPSGGPLAHLLNIWQLGAPALDFLSPDLYVPEFAHRCRIFTRAGNPLFIPETTGAERAGANALLAFGQYGAMGFSPFGIDGPASGPGGAEAARLAESTPPDSSLSQAYAALEKIMPALLEAQGTDKIAAVMIGPGSDDESATEQSVKLAGYTITCKRRQRPRSTTAAASAPTTAPAQNISGLFIAAGPDEFLVLTTGMDATFTKDNADGITTAAAIDDGQYIDGQWVAGRRLNGDETDHSRLPARTMQPYRVLRIAFFQRATS